MKPGGREGIAPKPKPLEPQPPMCRQEDYQRMMVQAVPQCMQALEWHHYRFSDVDFEVPASRLNTDARLSTLSQNLNGLRRLGWRQLGTSSALLG